MRQFFRHTILWLVALSILNTSIDIIEADPVLQSAPETGEPIYNEIESIAEFLLDEAIDQTLPDQKGNDEQGLLKKTASFDFSLPEKRQRISSDQYISISREMHAEQNQPGLPAGFITVFTPPPDQA